MSLINDLIHDHIKRLPNYVDAARKPLLATVMLDSNSSIIIVQIDSDAFKVKITTEKLEDS